MSEEVAPCGTSEDYTTWSIEKFCQLISQWREGAHMAGAQDAYLAYKRMLEPAEAAFKRLHPRAYQNFEQRFHEQFR
jgi:hypothetical protein